MKTLTMRGLSVVFGLMAGAVAIVGCSRRVTVLTGQVFIVTRSGESVRLGLVTVAAIPDSSISRFVALKRSNAAEEEGRLARDLSAADSAVAAAEREMASMAEKTRRVQEKYIKGEIDTDQWLKARSVGDGKERKEFAENHREEVRGRAKYWRSAGFYFDGLPAAVAVTKTDADGKFTLRIQWEGGVVLAAEASRELVSTTEKYHWLVRVPESVRESGSIMLSNDNVISSGSPTSVVLAEE
jgi:hypothetical protein